MVMVMVMVMLDRIDVEFAIYMELGGGDDYN